MNIEDIKKRCEAATEGPWKYQGDMSNGDHILYGSPERDLAYCPSCSRRSGVQFIGTKDGRFIAHARTDIPDLIAAYKRQKHRADHLFKQVPALKKHIEDLESEVERLRKEKHLLQQLWVTVNLSCSPPEDCNDPVILKKYMKACIDKADEYEAMKKDEE